jgi:transposase
VYEAFLIGAVEAKPDITMPELAVLLMEAHGVTTAPAAVSRFLCRRGFTYKKMPDGVGMRTHPTFVRSAGSGKPSVSPGCG